MPAARCSAPTSPDGSRPAIRGATPAQGGTVHRIADSAHRADRARVTELCPNLGDVHVNGAHASRGGVTPDIADQLLSAEDSTRPAHQIAEQVELGCGQ